MNLSATHAAFRQLMGARLFFALLAVGLAAYVNCLFWYYTEYRVGFTLDSTHYLSWHPMRPPGYPAFVELLMAVTGDLRWLGVAQLNLLLLSFLILCWSFARLTRSRVLGLALMALLCGMAPLIRHANLVLSETVFAAMVCLHLAALCFCLRRGGALPALSLGATAALAFMVRPNGVVFMATPLLLLLFTPPPHII